MSTASVALPLPIEQTYSYLVPDDLKDLVRPGSAVLVPFGRQLLTGIVTALQGPGDTAGPGLKLKPIADLLDLEPVLSAEQLKLGSWIASYYLCGPGEALRAMLPPGIGSASERRVCRTENAGTDDLSEVEQSILKHLPEDGTITVRALQKLAPMATGGRLRRMESRGWIRIELGVRGPATRIRTETLVVLVPGDGDGPPRGPKQQAVLAALAAAYAHSLSRPELLRLTGASSSTVNRLVELGRVELRTEVVDRSRNTSGASPSAAYEAPRHALLPAQENAVESISDALRSDRFQTFLLHGVTGSGKTEVYLRALESTLALDRSAIILVPEISLTPQTVARFRSRFGDRIAVLHSRMSPGERYDAWRGIRRGDYRIVIGARSAIFAPVRDLGLVVVDEEHEQSYKQFDPAPRYHARDVAVIRAMNAGAVCVLGSATPSLESLVNARTGKYTLLALPERVQVEGRQVQLPEVRIVDMRAERAPDGSRPIISDALNEAIAETLKQGQQVILLQNRRGYAPVMRCSSCSWTPDCPDCSVSMTYHKSKRHLRCHYCGLTRRLPELCPSCGGTDLLQLGIGTQRVEEELERLFPDVRVARMDLDTTSEKNAHHRILDRFAAGKADILLGTQMVSKGLDFGNVSLVGIISADTGLQLPDIRSEERTFQLLTQVAGRAGRAELSGEVVLQTYNPGHRVIQHAMRHDYKRFTENILPERSALQYPPFGKIINVLFTGPSESMVHRLASQWSASIRSLHPGIQLLGPSPSFIGRVRKNHRSQVMIKVGAGESHGKVRELIRRTNTALGSPPKNYRVIVDVDPAGLA